MSSNTPEQPFGQQPPSYESATPTESSTPTAQPGPYGQQPPAPYGQQPQFGAPYGAPAVDPGKTMGIIALILPFVGFSLVGLVLGIIAKVKSKKAGFKNTPALIAIIVSIVITIGSIIAIIVGITLFMNVTNEILEACQTGAETVTINNQVISCAGVTP